MAKNKKSFFERLSELNDLHDNKLEKKTTNKKKRSKLTITIAVLLTAGVIAAISIPLALGTTKVNFVPAAPKNEIVAGFKDPKNNKKVDFNLGLFEYEIDNTTKNEVQKLDDLYKEAIFSLYNEEQVASKEYQFRVNSSLNEGDSRRTNIELKTLDKIKEEQKQKLEDQKLNLQRQYGFSNWREKFNELLLSDEYGKSKSETEAIDYLTFKVVEHEATRRFRISIKKQSADFLKTANKDYVQLSDGGTVVVVDGKTQVGIKQGEAFFPYFHLLTNANQIINENTSGILYSKIATSNQIVTLSTESYVPEHMSAAKLINDYLKTHNLGITTKITLPGHFQSSLNPEFTFDTEAKRALANIFKYAVTKTQDNKLKIERAYDIAFDAQKGLFLTPAYEYLAKQDEPNNDSVSQYSTYLGLLTNTKDNLATTGINNFLTYYKDKVTEAAAVLAPSLLELSSYPGSLPTVDFATLFKLPTKLQADVEAIINPVQNSEDPNQLAEAVKRANKLISDFIDNSSSDNFKAFIEDTYNKNLVKQNVNFENQTSFAYNVKDLGGYLVLDGNTINWVRRQNLSTTNVALMISNKMLKATAFSNDNLPLITDINQSYDKYQILSATLKDNKVVANLQKDKNLTAEELSEYQKKLEAIIAGAKNSQLIDAYVAISNFAKNLRNTTTNYNTYIKDGNLVFAYRNTNGEIQNTPNTSAEQTFASVFKTEADKPTQGGN